MDSLMTLAEVADYLRLSRDKVCRMAQTGVIPAAKVGTQWRFRHEDVGSWIEDDENVGKKLEWGLRVGFPQCQVRERAVSEGTAISYKFSGHQTFAFRYGWLEKGIHGVDECATIFSEPDAIVRLGVGKNMVSSIRHWCHVTQLVEADPEVKGNRGCHLRASEIGRRLLLDPAWDPFLEDDASLWLIHWLLVSNPEIGTAWQLLFSKFHRPDFTRRELTAFVVSFLEKESLNVSDNVLNRDVDCLIRTYAGSTSEKKKSTGIEEGFDCPLLELHLIQPSPDGELYRFAIGPKPSLPPAVFAYALCQYFDRVAGKSSTLSVQKCLYGAGSPGQAFKLDENSLISYVEDLEDQTASAMILDETAGLKQIYRRKPVDGLQTLDDYYRGSRLT